VWLLGGVVILQAGGCRTDGQGTGVGSCELIPPCKELINPDACPSQSAYGNRPDNTPCKQGVNEGICIAGTCELDCEKDSQTPCSCTQSDDCPQPIAPKCGNATCANKTCGLNIMSDVVLDDTNPNNCQKFICDAKGAPIEVADDVDLPLLMTCHVAACNQGVQDTSPLAVGTMCGGDMSNPDVCDSTGACVECVDNGDGTSTGCPVQELCYAQGSGQPACTICHNGVPDGGETAVDCGGTATHNKLCPGCAKGDACNVKEDCGSGASNCVDGVCCTLATCDKCAACNNPWSPGACSALQVGAKPTDGGTDCLCDGSGGCVMTNKNAFNESCLTNGDCYSNVCANGFCKIPLNGLCATNDDCGMGTCNMMSGSEQFTCKP
jgi:hypothetical protein